MIPIGTWGTALFSGFYDAVDALGTVWGAYHLDVYLGVVFTMGVLVALVRWLWKRGQ